MGNFKTMVLVGLLLSTNCLAEDAASLLDTYCLGGKLVEQLSIKQRADIKRLNDYEAPVVKASEKQIREISEKRMYLSMRYEKLTGGKGNVLSEGDCKLRDMRAKRGK